MFGPGGSTDCLRACRSWEGGARCFVGRFLFRRRLVPEAGAFFGRRMTSNTISQKRYKRFVTPYYVLRLIAGSPRSQADTGNPQSPMARDYVSCGDERMQGTPWSEEFDGKELHGAAGGDYDLKPRGSVFPAHRVNITLPSIYKCSIILFLKGVVFLHDPLYC